MGNESEQDEKTVGRLAHFGVPGNGLWLGDDGAWHFENKSTYVYKAQGRTLFGSRVQNHLGPGRPEDALLGRALLIRLELIQRGLLPTSQPREFSTDGCRRKCDSETCTPS